MEKVRRPVQVHPEIQTRDPRFEMLPRSVVDLRIEVQKHPRLVEDLAAVSGLDEWYATIGVYCGIALDGWFTPQDLQMLTTRLHDKLQAIRHSEQGTILVN